MYDFTVWIEKRRVIKETNKILSIIELDGGFKPNDTDTQMKINSTWMFLHHIQRNARFVKSSYEHALNKILAHVIIALSSL